MEGVYFPVRVMKKLKAAGVLDRADLLERLDALAEMGLSDYDVRLVRRRLGVKPSLLGEAGAGGSGGAEAGQTVTGPELWTVREVVEYLSLSWRTISNWCGSGRIAAVKIGDDWRIPRAKSRDWRGVVCKISSW